MEDAVSLQRLSRNEMGYDYPVEEVKVKLEKLLASGRDKILVAVAEAAVVGYVHANDYDVIYAPGMKNIMGIAVQRDFRGKGIGKALLAEIEEWARKDGAKAVRLVSGNERVDAHGFYRHLGYHGDKQQINFKNWV